MHEETPDRSAALDYALTLMRLKNTDNLPDPKYQQLNWSIVSAQIAKGDRVWQP